MKARDGCTVVEVRPNLMAEISSYMASSGAGVRVDSELEKLYDVLHKQHPDWEFFADYEFVWGRVITRVSCTQGGEKLGDVWVRPYGEGWQYEALRASKDAIPFRRKHVKDMVKAVNGQFARITLEEVMSELAQGIKQIVCGASNTKRNRFSMVFEEYAGSTTRAHVMENWDSFLPLLVQKARDTNAVTKIMGLPELYAEAMKMGTLSDAVISGGVVVRICGATYGVYDIVTGHIEQYTTDTLPNGYKRAIGMLKLLSDDDALPNIGLRVSESVFYLCKGELDASRR